MNDPQKGALYGAIIGATGLPSVLLAFFTGAEANIHALHSANSGCDLGPFIIPAVGIVLGLIGLIIGASTGAFFRPNGNMLRKLMLTTGIVSVLLTTAGFIYEAVTFRVPAPPISGSCWP